MFRFEKRDRRNLKSPFHPTNLFFEIFAFFRGHGVGLGDDRYDVDLVAEPLHELDVERLESVAAGRDEVQATMNARVRRCCLARHTGLRIQELFILRLNEVDDRLPTKMTK